MARYFASPWRVGQRALHAALFLSMAALLLLVPARTARAEEPCTITWIEQTFTMKWNNVYSWDQDRLPGENDFVCIPAGAPGADVLLQDYSATVRGIRSDRTLVVTRGGLTLTDPAAPSVINGTLDLRDGFITNRAVLTVTRLLWGKGYLVGSGRTIVPAGGTLQIAGYYSQQYLMDGHTLENQGTATITNANLYIQNGSRLINAGTATFDYGVVWGNTEPSAAGAIENTGTLVKTGSTERLKLFVALNNTGTVRIEQGALEPLAPGGPQAGEFVVEGQLLFANNDATYVFGPDAAVSGNGRVVVAGGTVQMGGTYSVVDTTVTGGQLTLSQPAGLVWLSLYGGAVVAGADLDLTYATLYGGTLQSNAATTVRELTWYSGTLAGSGRTIIPADGWVTLDQYDPNRKAVGDGHTLELRGTGHLKQAPLTLGAGATLLNRGLLYVADTDIPDVRPSLDGPGTLLNQGTLRKTGTGLFTATANLVNAATVVVEEGTLRLDAANADHTGTFTGPGRLSFGGGTHVLGAGSVMQAMTVTIAGGTVWMDGTYETRDTVLNGGTLVVAVPTSFDAVTVYRGRLQSDAATAVSHLTLSGGALMGEAELRAWNFTWTAGNVIGATTIIPSGGQLTIDTGDWQTPQFVNLGDSTRLQNDGFVAFKRGILWNGSASTIINNGTFELQGSAKLMAPPNSSSLFWNKGTLTKVSGGGPEFMRLKNDGTVEVRAGTLFLNRGLENLANGQLTGGTWRIGTGASLQLPEFTTITRNNADLWLEGSASIWYQDSLSLTSVDALKTLNFNTQSGRITLSGGKVLNAGSFYNAGIVTMTNSTWTGVYGSYTQGSTGMTTMVNSTIAVDTSIESGGLLTGTGSFSGNLYNRGRLEPGGTAAGGVLTVGRYFQQDPEGTLRIRAGGPAPGVEADLLRVNRSATLGGRLEIVRLPGYTPDPNVQIPFVELSSYTGRFASVTAATEEGALEPTYITSGAVLMLARLPVWPSQGAVLTTYAVTETSVIVEWPQAIDQGGIQDYVIYLNGAEYTSTASTGYTFTGLEPGRTYHIEVRARDAVGLLTDPLVLDHTAPDLHAPEWPDYSVLTVTEVGEEYAVLTWPAATDNAGGVRYRLFVNDTLWRDDITETTVRVTGLTTQNTYGFRLEAGDASGNWTYGLTAVATTPDLTAPVWPEGAQITRLGGGEQSVELAWPVATDNVAVTGYRLYSGETLLVEILGPVTGFTVNGLRPGARYEFRLYALDAAGHVSATWLTAVVETPDWHAPFWADPPAITVDGVTTDSLVLHWPAARDNVAVTGYRVYQDGSLLATVTGTSHTVTGLTEGVSHEYRVQAGDAAGHWTSDGPVVVAAAADRTAPVWQPGESLAVSEISETGALLTWPVASDSTAVTYRVYLNGSLLGSTEALSYLLGGLNPGTAYTVRVAAGDAAGNWNQGLTASFTTRDDTAPVWPAASLLTASVSGDRVTLTWPGAQDNVGVTGYRIVLDDTPLTEVPGLTYTLTDVAPGDHRVAVAAVDAAGNAGPTLAANFTVDDNRGPVWPIGAGLTAVATGETTVDLQWPGAIDQSGRVTYLLLQNGVTVATLQGNEYTATNLRPGTRYTFSVKAKDSSGNWAGPVLSTAVTTYDEHAPTWPDGSQLRPASATAHSVTLSWSAAKDNSGKVTYRLDVNGVPGAECGKAPCTVDDLQPDTAYQIQVWAGDAAGQWAEGPTLQVQTKADGLVPVREATYAGRQVTLLFAERLNTAYRPAARDFRVNVNGMALTPGKVALDDRSVVLTLSQAVPAGATVTVDYVPAGAPMRTVSGARVASFRGFEAHGDPAVPQPPDEGGSGLAVKPVSLTATGREITLTFSGELKSDQVPAAKAFQVEVNGRAVAVSRVAVSGRTVTLTLLAPLPAGGKVTVSYRPGTPRLTDLSGRPVAPFSRLRAETPTP